MRGPEQLRAGRVVLAAVGEGGVGVGVDGGGVRVGRDGAVAAAGGGPTDAGVGRLVGLLGSMLTGTDVMI
jgi:hypothetical protein